MSEPPSGPVREAGGAPARDGEIAVQEEFQAAVRANTAEAYDLFVRRHPGHALATEARRRASQLPRGS